MTPTRSRDEHLEWAKTRALEYLDRGDTQQAYTSMASDLTKHPDLKYHDSVMHLGLMHLINGDVRALRAWIKGFR